MPLQFAPNIRHGGVLNFAANAQGVLTFSANSQAVLLSSGLLEASQAEAEAGAILGKYMSPLRVRQAIAATLRTPLTANTTLDVGSGQTYTTIQSAVDHAATLDLAGFTLTIQVHDGTYAESVTLKDVVGYSAPGCLTITGNATTPANVVVSPSANGNCFTTSSIPSVWDINNLKITNTHVGTGFSASGGTIRFNNLNFGSFANGNHMALANKAAILATGNYAVSGGAATHINNIGISFCQVNSRTITFSNAPAFTSDFVITQYAAVTWAHAMTFTNGGTVTGTRYSVDYNGVLLVAGGGPTYLPGSGLGSTSNGGVYA